MNNQYCMYLRKSRADIEAELHGEGETLKRHERILLDLSQKLNLNVTKIYREVVSGESIEQRPEMKKLLKDVSSGMWSGVLVVEVERLARGDTSDQGNVAKTFKFSETKIITPTKTYDPCNEFDEEYFEFGLFMSRREYKTINRRLQNGRLSSIKEGKYVGNVAPFGYDRVKLTGEKGFTLVPNDSADIIKLIFELFTVGEAQPNGSFKKLGISLIVKKLNAMHIKPLKNKTWSVTSIRDILNNPTYIGKLRWNRRKTVSRIVDGQRVDTRPRNDDYELCDGLHPSIITLDTWNAAQKILEENKGDPIPGNRTIKNPLAGLIVCGKCGRRMIRKPYKNYPASLLCDNPVCDNVSSLLDAVDERVYTALEEWLIAFKLKWEQKNQKADRTTQLKAKKKALTTLENERSALNTQMDSLYTFLERGIYTTEVFLQRSKTITSQIEEVQRSIDELSNELAEVFAAEKNMQDIIPRVESVLNLYKITDDPADKNELLKSVIDKVVYTKEEGGRWKDPSDFKVVLFPRVQ